MRELQEHFVELIVLNSLFITFFFFKNTPNTFKCNKYHMLKRITQYRYKIQLHAWMWNVSNYAIGMNTLAFWQLQDMYYEGERIITTIMLINMHDIYDTISYICCICTVQVSDFKITRCFENYSRVKKV